MRANAEPHVAAPASLQHGRTVVEKTLGCAFVRIVVVLVTGQTVVRPGVSVTMFAAWLVIRDGVFGRVNAPFFFKFLKSLLVGGHVI